MASHTVSQTCKRALRQSSNYASRQSISSASQRRRLHGPGPLLLDFLVPSWGPQMAILPAEKVASRQQQPWLPRQSRAMSSTPRRCAKAITNPRKDDEGNDMTITITPRAAHRLQTISETDNNPDLVLRVSVESGGCHGFQYLMSLVNNVDIDTSEDTVFENEEVAKKTGTYKAKIVLDQPSLELLKGSSIDYTMELIGSQFKVTGIPGAKSSCGCGTSFDIA